MTMIRILLDAVGSGFIMSDCFRCYSAGATFMTHTSFWDLASQVRSGCLSDEVWGQYEYVVNVTGDVTIYMGGQVMLMGVKTDLT